MWVYLLSLVYRLSCRSTLMHIHTGMHRLPN